MKYVSERMKTMNPSAVREIFKSLSDPEVISLAGGNPSPKTFPTKELSLLSEKIYRDNPVAFLQYGISEGHPELRSLTMERMSIKHGFSVENDDILITSGGSQAIDITLKTLTNEGDTVLCESPSFVGALNDIRSYNINLKGIPVDDEGMDIDALEKALQADKNVKLIYTIPTFQNPTGTTLSLERRKRMYELAVKYDVLILEDNPYFELRYSGESVPCIKSLDRTGHVIFCGSYSKTMAPGLRVGFTIADKGIFGKMVIAKQCADVNTSVYNQMLIAEFIKSYDYDAHIADSCKLYTTQRDRMLAALDRHVGDKVKFTRPQGGLFIWCTLPDNVSGYEFCLKTAERKVACVPGYAFDPAEQKGYPGIRLNFSMPSMEQIDTAVPILAECFDEIIK